MNLTQARFINGLYGGPLGRITNPAADLVARRNTGETRTLARRISFFSDPNILLDDKKVEAARLMQDGPDLLPDIRRLIPFCGEKPFEDQIVLKPLNFSFGGRSLNQQLLVHPDLAKIGVIEFDTAIIDDYCFPAFLSISECETFLSKLEVNLYDMVRRPRNPKIGIWQLAVSGQDSHPIYTTYEGLVSDVLHHFKTLNSLSRDEGFNMKFNLRIKRFQMYVLPCIDLWDKPAGLVLPFRK